MHAAMAGAKAHLLSMANLLPCDFRSGQFCELANEPEKRRTERKPPILADLLGSGGFTSKLRGAAGQSVPR
jgi:hypothetical protein